MNSITLLSFDWAKTSKIILLSFFVVSTSITSIFLFCFIISKRFKDLSLIIRRSLIIFLLVNLFLFVLSFLSFFNNDKAIVILSIIAFSFLFSIIIFFLVKSFLYKRADEFESEFQHKKTKKEYKEKNKIFKKTKPKIKPKKPKTEVKKLKPFDKS